MAPRVWSDVQELLRYLAENWPFDPDDPFEPKAISPDARLPGGDTPLHLVAAWDDVLAIELLARAGAPVDGKGDMGCTPLAIAVARGNVAAACLLLKLGASPNSTNEFGSTPYEMAMREGSAAMKALLGESAA